MSDEVLQGEVVDDPAQAETSARHSVSLRHVWHRRGVIDRPKFTLTPIGLAVTGNPSFDEWCAEGRDLWRERNKHQWAIGDWVRFGETRFGEKYAQARAITQYAPQTLMNLVFVAERFEFSRRREAPYSHSHHGAVAALPREDQDLLLDWCKLPDGSVRGRDELRAMVRLYKDYRARLEAGESLDEPQGSFAEEPSDEPLPASAILLSSGLQNADRQPFTRGIFSADRLRGSLAALLPEVRNLPDNARVRIEIFIDEEV